MESKQKLQDLIEALDSPHNKADEVLTIARSCQNEELRFHCFPSGQFLTHMGFPMERILIHLSGEVSVYKLSPLGNSLHGVRSEAPQIYGLYESLNEEKVYGASLRADSPVCCLLVQKDFFLREICESAPIAYFALQHLARFTFNLLSRANRLTLNSPYDNLVLYLSEKSQGQKLPYVLNEKNEEIAQELNISERSLYRYLAQLEKDKLIRRAHGKIVIRTTEAKNLHAAYITVCRACCS